MRASPVRRGCGSRKEGGVYLETGLSAGGSPIEEFLFDPPLTNVPADWLQPHRNPILFEKDGVWNVVIWVGAEHYPHVWDYIEEVRVAGSSRRVSSQFDFSKLTGASRQYFVHGEARADIDAVLDPHCPKPTVPRGDMPLHPIDAPGVNCLGFTKYLPAATPGDYEEAATMDGRRQRLLPCGHSYELYSLPDVRAAFDVSTREGFSKPTVVTEAAVFLQLPVTGIAMVNRADGSFDLRVEERVAKAKVETYRADE